MSGELQTRPCSAKDVKHDLAQACEELEPMGGAALLCMDASQRVASWRSVTPRAREDMARTQPLACVEPRTTSGSGSGTGEEWNP